AIRWGLLLTGLLILIPTTAGLFTTGGRGIPRESLATTLAGWLGRAVGGTLAELLGVVGGGLVVLFLALALPVVTIGRNPLGLVARVVSRLWSSAGKRGEAAEAETADGDAGGDEASAEYLTDGGVAIGELPPGSEDGLDPLALDP